MPEEKMMFKQGVVFLDHFREDILGKVLNAEAPTSAGVPEGAVEAEEEVVQEVKKVVISKSPTNRDLSPKLQRICDRLYSRQVAYFRVRN